MVAEAAGGDPSGSTDDAGSAPGAAEHGSPDGLAAALGRMSAQLDATRAELALSEGVRERLAAEVRRLQRRLDDVEVECRELVEKLQHRDRLLTQIFGSRSWRWTQSLRRALQRE